MFEVQYNDEMEAEVQRLEAKNRAIDVGHPEWDNACRDCGGRLAAAAVDTCDRCKTPRR